MKIEDASIDAVFIIRIEDGLSIYSKKQKNNVLDSLKLDLKACLRFKSTIANKSDLSDIPKVLDTLASLENLNDRT
jgi:hypothetical protein